MQEVKSPCIAICQLDDNKICIGCGRSVDEIMEWRKSTAERKREIVENARTRQETPTQ